MAGKVWLALVVWVMQLNNQFRVFITRQVNSLVVSLMFSFVTCFPVGCRLIPASLPACLPAVVSDAASGGQVLMCSRTFGAVQHMCEELGCVDHEGTNLTMLNAKRAPWWILG